MNGAPGASYVVGPATVGFVWTHTQLDGIGGVNVGGEFFGDIGGADLHLDNYEINGKYALTPMLSLAAAYTYTDGHFTDGATSAHPKWQQGTLEAGLLAEQADRRLCRRRVPACRRRPERFGVLRCGDQYADAVLDRQPGGRNGRLRHRF